MKRKLFRDESKDFTKLEHYKESDIKQTRESDFQNFKYGQVWKRARIKLRFPFFANKLKNDVKNQFLIISLDTIVQIPRTVFHPESYFRLIWEALMSLTILYIAIFTPFIIAFIEIDSLDAFTYIDLILDILYIIDFLINCSTAYFDSTSTLITDRKQIIMNYFKSWMLFDLISCIPFGFLSMIIESNFNQSQNYIRFVKLSRLYKLLRISKLLKTSKNLTKNSFFIKVQDYLNIKHSRVRFLYSVTNILIFIHMISCLWTFTAKIDNCGPDTWIYRLGYMDSGVWTLYFTGVYWAFTTLACVGYGDMSAYTISEKFVSILWMILALYFLAFTLSSLSSMSIRIDTKKKTLQKKIATIDEFISQTNIPKAQAHRIRVSLRTSCEIAGFSWIDKHHILKELPKNLRYEIAAAMHKGASRYISFFVDKDPAIKSSIIPFLTPLSVKESNFVYKQNDFADELYFIVKGSVQYIYNSIYVISSIYKSDYFGEIEIFMEVPRKFSAFATSNLELLAMNRKLLFNIKKEYLVFYEEMRKIAKERSRNNFLALSEMLVQAHRSKTRRAGVLSKRKSELVSEGIEAKIVDLRKLHETLSMNLDILKCKCNYKTQNKTASDCE